MSTIVQMQAIRDAQKRIRDQIKRIIEQLKQLENVPDSQPWISFNRVKTIEELKSPFRSLKEALMNDLLILRSRLRELEQEAKNLQKSSANRARLDFEREARNRLKEFEKGGEVPGEVMAELRSKAESVLDRYVNNLNANPTDENIKQTLLNLESPLMLGTDVSTGVGKRAFDAIGKASEKIVEQNDQAFRKSPTVKNLDKLIRSKTNAMLVGGQTQDLPSGIKPAHTTHQVKKNDTLSAISQIYYGSTSYWDVIYFENIGVIGNDPNKLRIGTELRIP